uniref:Carbohydrate binding domain protein n=1 Tax=Siphoviridae sp. ct5co22 TaxID=2826294 RepID=A0A8S5QTI8_9CAUD|nr:MAG TPA: carbohydrate binding domain protein [Siphoviridae sp. ct5co22]
MLPVRHGRNPNPQLLCYICLSQARIFSELFQFHAFIPPLLSSELYIDKPNQRRYYVGVSQQNISYKPANEMIRWGPGFLLPSFSPVSLL